MNFPRRSSTPGEMCAVELDAMTVMSFSQKSSTPGEMCAVELDSMTVMGFPRNSSTPSKMCVAELDFPTASSPPGESCAEERDYLYKADLVGWIDSVRVDGDWVTPLRISPQTCTELFPLCCSLSSAD